MTRATLLLVALLSLAVPSRAVAADAERGSVFLIRDVVFAQEPICFALVDVAVLPQLTVSGVPAQAISFEDGRACYRGPAGVAGPARAAVSWGSQTTEVDLRILQYQTAWQPDLLTVLLAGLEEVPGALRFELALSGQHGGGGPPQNVVLEPEQIHPDGTALIHVVAPGVPPDTAVLLANAVFAPEHVCCERDIEISGKFDPPAQVVTRTASASKVTLTFHLPLKWFCYGGFFEQSCRAFFAVTTTKSVWKDTATGQAVQPTGEQIVPFEPPRDKGKRIVCDGLEHTGVWSFTYEAELPTTNTVEADLEFKLDAASSSGVVKGTGYVFQHKFKGKDRPTFDGKPVKPNLPPAKFGCCETNIDLLAGAPEATPASRDGKLTQVMIDLPNQISILCGRETEPRQPCRAFYEIESVAAELLDSENKPLAGKAEATVARKDPPVGYPCESGEHFPVWAFRIRLRFDGQPASIRITFKALVRDASKGKSYEMTMTVGKVTIGSRPKVTLASKEIAPDK
jgi:hypothetical protein